jgi:hypothetical protein
MLSQEEVLKQSRGAMKQWESTWRSHAKRNGEILKDKGFSNQRIYGHGIGRKAICCAYSPSLEYIVDDMKEKNEAVDILCVDKAMGYLLDHGVKPSFVFLADAAIDYKKWCEKWIDQTEDICLMTNVTANPVWAENWKGKIFYFVNQDNIKTEEIFAPISGCHEFVKASSNVGNSVLVYATTYLLYDEYHLAGYDSCWRINDNYYCGEDSDKRWYMNHHQMIDTDGEFVCTSQNLLFTARWLSDFINMIIAPNKKKIFKCYKGGLVNIPYRDIKKTLKTSAQRKLTQQEMDHVISTRLVNIKVTAQDGETRLQEVLKNNPVVDVLVRTLPPDLFHQVAA